MGLSTKKLGLNQLRKRALKLTSRRARDGSVRIMVNNSALIFTNLTVPCAVAFNRRNSSVHPGSTAVVTCVKFSASGVFE